MGSYNLGTRGGVMKRVEAVSLVVAMLLVSQLTYAVDKENCRTIHGTYAHWEGHPPYERVEADDGKMYGLISSFEPDSDLQVPNYPLPESIGFVWDANEDVTGKFLFCFSKDTAKFKAYEAEPVELGWVKSFTPDDSSDASTFIRKLKIVAVGAANKISDSSQFGTVRVSFDYLDGVISNIELKQSNGHDAAVLAAITHADYPVTPERLKGQNLHVELPIYFPAEKSSYFSN
jgi:hypothetical protein